MYVNHQCPILFVSSSKVLWYLWLQHKKSVSWQFLTDQAFGENTFHKENRNNEEDVDVVELHSKNGTWVALAALKMQIVKLCSVTNTNWNWVLHGPQSCWGIETHLHILFFKDTVIVTGFHSHSMSYTLTFSEHLSFFSISCSRQRVKIKWCGNCDKHMNTPSVSKKLPAEFSLPDDLAGGWYHWYMKHN